MGKYRRIVSGVFGQPWALRREKLAVIVDLLRFRAEGGHLTDEEIQARIGAARAGAQPAATAQAVAVIPVRGVIAQHMSAMEDISGGTSTDGLARSFRAAMADPNVRAIVLDVDSPGGGVYGVDELASEIRAAAGTKKVVAVANAVAASAAYWLASAAEEFVVTPSGEVGSIGVYAAHEDMSKFLEEEGIKVTLISAGENKTNGNPFEPLSDAARAEIEASVQRYYGMFVAAVAKGRGVTAARVKSEFGGGRMFGAQEAVALGMADRVGTIDETIARLLSVRGAAATKAAELSAPSPLAAIVETVTAAASSAADASHRAAAETPAPAETPPPPPAHAPPPNDGGLEAFTILARHYGV